MDQSHCVWHVGERPEGCHHRPGVVCSRDANGRSGPGVLKHATAAKVVSKRRGDGGVGKRAGVTARPTKVWSGGATRHRGIGSGGASGEPRQLTRSRCARASAQRQGAKILRRGDVNGRDATNISRSSMNNRADVFCSVACRLALRRVLVRESRCRERRRHRRVERVTRRARPPATS